MHVLGMCPNQSNTYLCILKMSTARRNVKVYQDRQQEYLNVDNQAMMYVMVIDRCWSRVSALD
jgi:hypothetical protein